MNDLSRFALRWRSAFYFGCALAFGLLYWFLPAGAVPAQAQTAVCGGSAVTGVSFRDYNFNGARDPLEPGLSGIVVTAYDSNGGSTACTTNPDGTYGIDPVSAYPLRLEYTLPTDGSLAFLQPGVAGSDSQTTVTFVNGPSSGINIGFSNPSDYCQSNPQVATTCAVFGEQGDNADGVNKAKAVIYGFPYTAGSMDMTDGQAVRSPAPSSLALAQAVGTTWGLAWSPMSERLYAAAFLKRHAGYGPNGPGAIYQIVPGGASSLFYDLGSTAVGGDPHAAPGQTCLSPGHNSANSNANCWLHDADAFDWVGKMGLGDLDIADDFQTLYTVNLFQRTLVALPIADPARYASKAIPVPANCPLSDFRPFGLGVQDGSVYVGAVCSAESSGLRSQLRAYVFRFVNNAFITTPVFEFALDYERDGNSNWQPWLNRATFDPVTFTQQGDGKWGQPWLTDIAFDNGAMVLGLRDRNADLFGVVAGGPDHTDSTNYTGFARGDILRACPIGSGGWTLESNGQCGGVATAGAGNGHGPGGGEYYFQDEHPRHEETSNGAQLQLPGQPEIASVIYNPIDQPSEVSDGGINWYDNHSGVTVRSYLVFDGSAEVARFDKANGLGDIEALCTAAPLEIGNRIWHDSNANGVQDPNEAGLNGVVVELYRDRVLVGTTTTSNDGNYLFNDSNVTLNGAAGIEPNLCGANGLSVYELRIPNSSGLNQQAALGGLMLTPANLGGATNGNLRDSDGSVVGNTVGYAIPCAELAGIGLNNHTFDFGFTALPSTATPTATPTLTPMPTPTPPPGLYSLGNYVWLDANRNGLVDSAELPAPNSVLLELLDGAGTATGRTTTTANGFYLFSGLSAGNYRVRLAASNFAAGSLLAGYTSSDGAAQEADPNLSGDQNDNGLDNDTPATTGITTSVITLGNGEPTGEAPTATGLSGDDGEQTPDDHSNLTVDFGLYLLDVNGQEGSLVALGNFVFLDTNNNGRFDATTETGLAGVSLQLFLNGATTPLATTMTSSSGFYVFDNLQPGTYTICVAAANFANNQMLKGYRSSTGAGIDTVTDQEADENGIDTTSPAVNGVCSNVIELKPNLAPTRERQDNYLGRLDDDNVNFTIDFGFVQPTNLDPRDEPGTTARMLFLPIVRHTP